MDIWHSYPYKHLLIQNNALANSGVTLSFSWVSRFMLAQVSPMCLLRCHLLVLLRLTEAWPLVYLHSWQLCFSQTSFRKFSLLGISYYLVLLMQVVSAFTENSLTHCISWIQNQDFVYQAIDGHFISCRNLQVLKSFPEPFLVLRGTHSQTANKSVSWFLIALTVIGSRGPHNKSFPKGASVICQYQRLNLYTVPILLKCS